MKRYSRTLFPPLNRDYSTLALRPVLIAGLVTPVVGGDGGVNISMVEDNLSGLLTVIDPWLRMQVGDRVDIYWDGLSVGGRDVTDADIDKRMAFYLPTEPIQPDWAEKVSYSLTRAGSNVPEESAPLRLRVKLDRPGGKDRDPHQPGHSELAAPQLPQDVIDNGVDAQWAKDGIPVTIAAYPGRAARDTLELRWGVVSIIRPITEEEAAGTSAVVITVDQAVILAAGDADELLVHYQVYDEVGNFSEQWSLQTFVAVEAGAWKLPPPIIQDAVNGEIDLGTLGSANVTVNIPVTADPFELGDTVTMTWLGTTAAGAPLTYSQSVTIRNIPAIYDTTVPNALVREMINGTAQASYVLTKANGDPPQSSKRAAVRITGVAPLQIPRILELIGDVLDAREERAHVEIPVYAGMANGDLINLDWLGTRSDGTPYVYETQHIVTANDVGNVVYIPVMGEHIALLENGTLDVSYRVSNDAWQVFDVRVSEHLLVRVGQHVAELPAPIIVEAPDGVLDPEVNPGDVTLRVNYPGTVAGDKLTWYWLGHPLEGSGSDWIPITTALAGKPVDFTIPRSLVEPNINDEVRVLYTLERGVTGTFQYSATLDLVIGKLIGELPAPAVVQASAGVLDPMDALAGATVRVSYASMEAQDLVTLVWLGSTGIGTPADQEKPGSANGQVEFTVPATVIGANIGREVSVYYRVKRYTAEKQSEMLRLPVLPFGDPDKDLPHPVITQANSQTMTLNLATFTGNGTATVAKWPFSLAGQRVWLRLEGETSSGGVYSITLLDGAPLTSGQASAGLSESALRTELEKLGQDTRVVVICNVAFDGTASENAAVQFPRTVYTFKLHHDWVNPQIVSIKDSKGEVAEGGTTFDTTLSISGTSTIEAELEILDGATRLDSVRANASGGWSTSLSALTPKTYSFTAKALDGSGLISPPRRLEVLANVRPVINQVLDSRGPVSNGGTTVDTSVTVSGLGSADQQVELFDRGVSKGTARTNGSGAWSLTVTGLAVASHPFTAKALYGTQPESAVWTVIIAATVTPTITHIKDTQDVEIPPDGFTVDTSVVLTGTASAGLEVEVFDGTVSQNTATANPSGQWTLTLTGLSVARHDMKVRANYGSNPESTVRKFTVTAVVTPTITRVEDPQGTLVSNGGSTYANAVTASGKASIGQSVEVFDGASSRGTASMSTSGNWSRSVSGLSVGAHSLTAKALYASNPVSSAWTFNVQAATAPTLSVRDTKGEIAQGGTTTETTVTASGTAVANAQVEVFDGGASRGTTAVGGTGSWSLSVSVALGSHSIKAVGRYADNPSSGTRNFTVVSPIPDFVLDSSPVSLNGALWGLAGYPGHEPLSWPAGTTLVRIPSSGVPPYVYSSSDDTKVQVNNNGRINSVSNGVATITVQDGQGRRGSYNVTVSNVTMVYGLGNDTFKGAQKTAASRGLGIPSLDVLNSIWSQYGNTFPMGEKPYWSSTSAPGILMNYTKNLVTGEQGSASIKYENFGSYANIVAI
ncbi:hypothetical protein [Pseudomonas petrae]|uniref:hypothetical protein n=1 Tax=Pseudomonas petrae TaxID=2912190 RepID=UPI001EF09DEB|nr:hypothetical protein [Pseudomonas petrae]MCF7530909.1 hypothetical protein [Pseudomonas petrae]MCF7536583.1 hypothetical protein [Pseudomonas petrae]MCF7554263.1 hypothetical protein [Pseudomonas petrae]